MHTSLAGKRVTVMGLGLHGGALGTIKWLHGQGAKMVVTDMKKKEELESTLAKLKKYPDIEYVLGEHREQDFTNTDMVIRNPAVPRTSKYLELARQAGVPIEMDSSLFFQHSPSQNIIGVTGSKGKTTTSSAIAALLKAHYPQAVAVGIDGISPLGELPNVQADSPVVFELSSWRLEGLDPHKLSPKTAVVTSLYPDHLNTYASFQDYIETKKIIIKYQRSSDRVLLNADDELVKQWEPEVKGQLYWYSAHNLKKGRGIFVRDGQVTVRLTDDDETVTIMPWDDLPLAAEHERRNLLPAILLGIREDIPLPTIKRELQHLRRLPHRLEQVRLKDAVTYINDSAATMPEATQAALKSFAGKTIVHILGGSDKKLEFVGLAKTLADTSLRALVFLPGTATDRMKAAIMSELKQAVPMHDGASMTEAVSLAAQAAQSGDVILLSPGATSFGLFQHEFDRGNQFRAAVNAL